MDNNEQRLIVFDGPDYSVPINLSWEGPGWYAGRQVGSYDNTRISVVRINDGTKWDHDGLPTNDDGDMIHNARELKSYGNAYWLDTPEDFI